MAKDNPGKSVINWMIVFVIIGLLGLIALIIFGNLSGNVGFAANSQGANDTNQYIGNVTGSIKNVGAQLPVSGTILGIVLLITLLVGVLAFVIYKLNRVNSGQADGAFA